MLLFCAFGLWSRGAGGDSGTDETHEEQTGEETTEVSAETKKRCTGDNKLRERDWLRADGKWQADLANLEEPTNLATELDDNARPQR